MNDDVKLLNFIYQNSQMGVETIDQLEKIVEDKDFKKYLKDEVVHGIQQTINENTQNIENNTNAITQNTQDIQNSVTSISNLITSFNGMQTDVSNIQDQVLVLYDKLNKTFPVCRTIEVRQTD